MARKLIGDDAAGGGVAVGIPQTTTKPSQRSRGRLRGVDAARAVAVLGMVMVHFGPNPRPETALGDLYGISHGRASVLFALLASVGVALLLDGRRSRERPARGSARRTYLPARGRLVLRGALLLPLGLWLQQLDHGAYVILQYYAVYFLFAALVLTLPDRWLLAGGAVVLVGGPLVYLWGAAVAPEWYLGEPASLGDTAGKIARDLFLTGKYPLVTWAAPLLVGMWVGRRDLSAATVRWWLLVLGVAVAVAAAALGEPSGERSGEPGQSDFVSLLAANIFSDQPHNQMPLWMLGSIGSACAVLGGMLLLADRLPRAVWPLVATGQLALTVYVGHLLLLHALPDLLKRETVPEAFFAVGAFMLLAVLACTLWRAALPRGPLEAAFAAPWWIAERAFGRISRRFIRFR